MTATRSFPMVPWMISFSVQDGNIELDAYQPEATLADLAAELDGFRMRQGCRLRECYACGECCRDPVPVLGYDVRRMRRESGADSERELSRHLSFPEKPDLVARKKGISDMMRQHDLAEREATLIYEYNQCESIAMARRDGACGLLSDRLCTVHDERYYICELFFCRLGERLSGLFDSIVSQGVWHSYFVMDWIPAEAIGRNPFLKADAYDELLLSDFDTNLEKAVEKLFFYF